MDQSGCKAVWLFTMHFSKAIDTVNHNLLSTKLKLLSLKSYIVSVYTAATYLLQ